MCCRCVKVLDGSGGSQKVLEGFGEICCFVVVHGFHYVRVLLNVSKVLDGSGGS